MENKNWNKASGSEIRGRVVISDDNGRIVLDKDNMIVSGGRSYISGLVSGAIAGTLSSSTNKISKIKFGTGGATVPASAQTALVAEEAAYEIELDVTRVWKKKTGVTVYSGTYNTSDPGTVVIGAYFFNTTSSTLKLGTAGSPATWATVTPSSGSYFVQASGTSRLYLYTSSWSQIVGGTGTRPFPSHFVGTSGSSDPGTVVVGAYFFNTSSSTLKLGTAGSPATWATVTGSTGMVFYSTTNSTLYRYGASSWASSTEAASAFYETGLLNLYTNVKSLTVSSLSSPNIGMVFTCTLRGIVGSEANISELGLFTNTPVLFSRLAFDQIPLTGDLDAYNISYYVYF
jgi:hypothetical protein